jgi:hypothetical protein
MNTEESDLKTKLVAQCKKAGAYARRFEDRYGVGILDTLVIFDSLPVCFIEAKIIHSREFGPTERQWIEGNRILKLKGGHAFPVLVGWNEDKLMYVGEWARKMPVKACICQLKGDDYAKTLWRFVHDYNKHRGGGNVGRGQENSLSGENPSAR